MAKKQLNLFMGLELSKDSEKNKQKLINTLKAIGNAVQKQNEQFKNTGQATKSAGDNMRLLSKSTQDARKQVDLYNASLAKQRRVVRDLESAKIRPDSSPLAKAKDTLKDEQLRAREAQEILRKKVEAEREASKEIADIHKIQANAVKASAKKAEEVRQDTIKVEKIRAKALRTSIKKEKDAVRWIRERARAQRRLNAQTRKGSKETNILNQNMTMLAWHLRFLGNIVTNIGRVMVRTLTEWVTVGARLQDSFFGLSTSVSLFGMDASKAKDAAQGLAETGLVPLTSSTKAYNNVLLTGAFTIDEATDFMERFLDVSTLVTAGQDEMAKSLVFLTESILRGTMVLGTDVATRAIWNMAEDRAIKTMGKSMTALSAKNRAIIIAKTLQEDFNKILGIHEIRMNLIGATLTKMKTKYEALQLQMAEKLWPVIIAISDAFVKFVNIIITMISALGPLAPALITAAVAMTVVTGALLTMTAVAIGSQKIFGALATKYALTVPHLLILYAVVTALSWAWLYFSGALKKTAINKKLLNEEFKAATDLLKEESDLFGKSSSEADTMTANRKKQHQRTLEDLEEQLKRERSKGLWADQLKIKDLEKRIKRENEDYADALKERENGMGNAKTDYEKKLDKMVDETEKATKAMGQHWSSLEGIIGTTMDWVLNRFDEWTNAWDELGVVGKATLGTITATIGSVFIGLGILGAVKAVGGLISAINFIVIAIAASSAAMTTFGIIAAAVYSAAIISAWNLYNIMGDVEDRMDDIRDTSEDLRELAKEAYNRGDFKEYQRLMDVVHRNAEDVIQIQSELPGSGFLRGWNALTGQPDPFTRHRQSGHLQVPGNIGQPIPTILHGGERIIPEHENRNIGSGGDINIYYPSVRNDNDITAIANAVSDALAQKQRWTRLGAY